MRTVTLRWFAAFTFLLLTVHEAHELAHAITGRLVCGIWPERDFNAWRIVGDCSSFLPTAAGPVFSFLLMLAGSAVALRAKPEARWAGLALLFSANPFARIFTAVMGGGDEMVVAQSISGLATRTMGLRIAVVAVVGALAGTAIVCGWKAMSGLERRTLWFALILLWPMIVTGALFVGGNRLLRAGVLAEMSAGTPMLVILTSAGFAVAAGVMARWLFLTQRPAGA